jgi:hypothetical protein
MSGDMTLMALLPGGVHLSTSIDKTPENKPYIMYRQAADRPDLRGDDSDQAESTTWLIFAHDVPGSYSRIDAIQARIKELFRETKDPDEGIIRCHWLESSDDFRDDEMGTITRYCRVQVKQRTGA